MALEEVTDAGAVPILQDRDPKTGKSSKSSESVGTLAVRDGVILIIIALVLLAALVYSVRNV